MFFILRISFTLEKHENHSKYPKNTEKNLKCLKKNWVSPKKVWSVGFPETRNYFFGPIYKMIMKLFQIYFCIITCSMQC